MRKLSTVAAFLLLRVLVVQAQPPDGKGTGKGVGKGGGYAAKNLQVLDNNTFPNSMQNFVQALGVADQGRSGHIGSGHTGSGHTARAGAGRISLLDLLPHANLAERGIRTFEGSTEPASCKRPRS